MTGRVLALARSRWVRVGFLVLALALAVAAVVGERDAVGQALAGIPVATGAGVLGVAVVYVVLTMLAWRAVLTDLGSALPLRVASTVFFVSQLGKYVPGGVWNVVAAAELASGHEVPRRRSVSAMAVTILVSIVTGGVVAFAAVALGPEAVRERYGWVAWLLPLLVVALVPPVLNRGLGVLLRLARRPGLEHPLTLRGTGAAVAWSTLAWLVAGGHVWLLATAVGMPADARTFALAAGAYALAWVVGFLVVVVPAGLGAREAVLLVALAAVLDRGDVLAVVLLSRIALTVADVGTGLAGLAVARGRRGAAPDGGTDARAAGAAGAAGRQPTQDA